ncbi:hypothetical protein HHK36_026156 [Tetracentron sinense]|uniref:Ubiquitin-like protease family profile domain-containing protein n=1 Tax=Tetracentron sinense TaxID=13715 RepID=A0A835D481_TETSI|nr:hypothetical protein HHK36_026156 [Tetracentron sinense]
MLYRIGLGSLLQIHEKIHLRRHIIDFVVEHYSLKSGAVIVDNTTMPISLTDMVLCFGLPVVGSQIVLEGNKESIRELCDHYQIKGGYIYKVTLEKMLKVDDSGEGFQRIFILYVLCTLFVPHARQYVSEKYLHTLVNMKTVRKIAWGEFAYSTLVEAIYRVKDGKVANVGGFVLFLQILPCDVSTKLDERGNEDNEQPLLVISEGLPNLAFGVKDEHLYHNDVTELLSKALEQISDLQRIIGVVHSMAIGSAQRLLFLGSDSKEMNMLGSTVAKRVAINSPVTRRTHKRKCYKSYVDELPTHQRIKLRKAISTLPRQPTWPSLFPSFTASQKAAVDNAQRCDSIHSMSDIVVRIDEAFVYRAAFKTLEPGGLLDDMFVGLEYVFGGKQLEGGLSYNFKDWDCEYEKSVPQQQNSMDCGIFMIGYIEYWNGEPSSIPFTQVDIEAYRDKITVSLLLSPLNRDHPR